MADDQFYKTLLDNLHDAIYFTDKHRKITYWNRGAERLTGYRAEEVVGSRCSDNILMHVDENGVQLCRGNCPLAQTMKDGEVREASLFLHHHNGHRVPVWVRVSPIRDESGKIVGGVEIFNDRSTLIADLEKISELQKELYLDPLTKIGNRRYTQDRLDACLAEYRRRGVVFGALFVDIDFFKKINDQYGHNTGDRVLEMVSATLASNLRPYDFVGRWGGEEFIVLINNVDTVAFKNMAERLRRLVERSSLLIENEIISVTVSIGGALVKHGDDINSLLNRADARLYDSKNSGRNRVTIDE